MAQLVQNYASALTVMHRQVSAPIRVKGKWRKPPPEFVKISCDGGFQQIGRSEGWGFVTCDSEGEVISTCFGKMEKVLEPIHAELIACLQALQRATDLGLQWVILETDTSMVVQAVACCGS